MPLSRFAKVAWAVLAYNLLVILWGATVRATGSGAGCGSHWPLCQGAVIPRAPRLETLIEFTHRLSSGLVLVLALALLVWAWRRYPRRHAVRLGAGLVMAFTLGEALLGAGLVLFSLVADNASTARAFAMAAHLVNTFLLLASLALTASWASGAPPLQVSGRGSVAWALGVSLLAVLIVGMTGAVTALGDTLFPPQSLAEGLRQDFSPAAGLLIRLRVIHPILAASVGIYLFLLAAGLGAASPAAGLQRRTRLLMGLVLAQLAAGAANVLLLAPLWLQLLHLFLADLVWLSLVLLAAWLLAQPEPRQPAEPRTSRGSGTSQ